MVSTLKLTLPAAAWNAGQFSARRKLPPTEVAGHRVVVWLPLAMSVSVESPQKENVEPNSDEVTDSDASQET